MSTTARIPKAKLAAQDSATLVKQYEMAMSAPHRGGKDGAASRGQERINYIVDLLEARSDDAANAFFDAR